jgi:hypothetical protein
VRGASSHPCQQQAVSQRCEEISEEASRACLVLPMFAISERTGQRQSPGHVNVSRETLCVEHPLTLSTAGYQSAMRRDLRGSEPSVPGSPDVRYIGESRSGNNHQDTWMFHVKHRAQDIASPLSTANCRPTKKEGSYRYFANLGNRT